MRTMLPSVLLALTAGWFTACESDEEPATTPNAPQQEQEAAQPAAIAFGGAVGAAEMVQNRATTSPLENHIQQFHLWGYKTMSHNEADGYQNMQTVFDGYTVEHTASSAGTSSDNTAGWHYVGGTSTNSEAQTIKYWDFSATSYRFMAVAGSAVSPVHSVELAGSDYRATLSCTDINPDTDLWFAKLWLSDNTSTPLYGETVQLRFFSPFCKVRFMLIDEHGEAITALSNIYAHITPGTISFYPNSPARQIGNEGSLQMAYPITGKATEETFQATPSNRINLTLPYESHPSGEESKYAFVKPGEKEHWYILLPSHTSSAFTLEMEYDGMPRKAVVPAEFMMWNMNHEYTYVFKVTPQGLSFEPYLYVFKEWQSGYVPDAPAEW